MNFPWFVLFAGYFLFLAQRTNSKDIDCGSHFTSKTGSFSSPGYPNRYSPGLLCVWTVRVTGSNPEIRLTFREFDLPPKTVDGECLDFVAIFSGTLPNNDKLMGKYCDSGTPSSLLVKDQAVYIQFVSNEDAITGTGFVINFSTSSSTSSITTSQATAGIVAAIFCGIVFLGVGAMRCVMMGACQRCQNDQTHENRECVGTHETVSNYVMDCPPSYRTVMEHPERFPTPNISPHISPTSTPRASHYNEQNEVDDDDSEPPPPYSRVIPSDSSIDQDIDMPGTSGQNVQQIHVNGERTIPVNSNNSGDNLETVIIHSNPRDTEPNDTEIERTESSTSANGGSSNSIASPENLVSSNNSELRILEELDSDIENNESNDRHSPGAPRVDPRNTSTGASNGSISIVDHNNEPISNYNDGEDNDDECCITRVQVTEPQRNGHTLGRKGGSPTYDHSTQTDVALSRGGQNVWL